MQEERQSQGESKSMKYIFFGLVIGFVVGSFIGIPVPLAIIFGGFGGMIAGSEESVKKDHPDLAPHLESTTGQMGAEIIALSILAAIGVALLLL